MFLSLHPKQAVVIALHLSHESFYSKPKIHRARCGSFPAGSHPNNPSVPFDLLPVTSANHTIPAMDCLHFGGWLPSTSKGRPAFQHYLRRSIPHRRSHAQSPDRTSLLSHHHHHQRSHGMEEPKSPTVVDNPGGNWQNGTKRYQVTISSRGLKWQDLQDYLELEFSGLKVTDEQVEKVRKSPPTPTLPRGQCACVAAYGKQEGAACQRHGATCMN